ncbi:MAG: hypothetical protein KBC84_08255 [Proteobacteria bacterium]|nr:hypothetical protein [Pseudomonadota bacterium]
MAIGINAVEEFGFGGEARLAQKKIRLDNQALYSALFLIVLQILDGILTSIGVGRFGYDVEGNPFLKSLMMDFGCVPVLAVMKAVAIGFIIFLMFNSMKMKWIQTAMRAVSYVYIFSAIAPWTYILILY